MWEDGGERRQEKLLFQIPPDAREAGPGSVCLDVNLPPGQAGLLTHLIGGLVGPLTLFSLSPLSYTPSLQQEILSRRRSGTWKKDVEERRTKVSRYLRDPTFKKEVDKERSARFKATQEAEAKQREEEAKQGVKFLPFYQIPFGLPEYDVGERFDLRLPYVDNGYVDEDADPVKQFRRFIGLDKKKDEK